MRRLLVILILPCAFYAPLASASDEPTEFGQLETVGINDYDFHLPLSVNMNGSISLGVEGISSEDEQKSEHTETHVVISPLAVFSYEAVERNVCSQKMTLTLPELKVPLATACTPMWNLRKKTFVLGAGLEAKIGLAGVGIVPLKETEIFQKRAIFNGRKTEAALEFPLAVGDFSNWAVGDQISYEKSLGLVIRAAAESPVPFLEIVPEVERSSAWEISVEKTSDTSVEVNIETSKSTEREAYLGAEVVLELVHLGVSSKNSNAVAFHFVINLQEPMANEAYQKLLKGSVEEAILLSGTSKAIMMTGTNRERAQVKSSVIAAGVPMLFGARSSRGVMRAVSVDDVEHKMNSTLVFRERSTEGLLSRHKIKGEYLAASVESDKKETFGHFGFVAFWSFEKEKLNDVRLERKVNGFLRGLGLAKKAKLALPNDSDGYLRGELQVSFSSASLKSLVNMIQSQKSMEAFLSDSGLDEEIQDEYINRWSRIAAKIRKARKAGDAQTYSRQIVLLAREMIEEATVFHSWIKATGGVEVSVRVSGEKIPESSFTAMATELL